jgi:hypothetical protein
MTIRASIVCLAALAMSAASQAPAGAPWSVRFTDIAAEAGLTHPSVYGGIDRKRFILETNGCGTAFIDYDRDGWLDALVLAGTRLDDRGRGDRAWPPGTAPRGRLYRNLHNGRFEDVTDRTGLTLAGWASSLCAGDYDNDGWVDFLVTYYGRTVLYRNRDGRRFEDVTRAAGLTAPTDGGDRGAVSSTTTAMAISICSSRTTSSSIARRPRNPARAPTASGRGFP